MKYKKLLSPTYEARLREEGYEIKCEYTSYFVEKNDCRVPVEGLEPHHIVARFIEGHNPNDEVPLHEYARLLRTL